MCVAVPADLFNSKSIQVQVDFLQKRDTEEKVDTSNVTRNN